VTVSSESIFENRSGYFDGASYLSVPDSDDFNFGANDFTIDLYVNFSTLASTYLVCQGDYITDELDYAFRLQWDSSNQLRFYYSTDGLSTGLVSFTTAWTPSQGVWYHLAAVRLGTVLSLYVDGIEIDNFAMNTDSIHNSSHDLDIGGRYVQFGGGTLWGPLDGYIDGLRIFKDKALWTENFLPPNAPPKQVEEETVLLLHCNGADASTTFIDSGVTQHAVTANDNAQISTAQSVFGESSAYFDGSGDYLNLPSSSDWALSTSDMTIDCRFYIENKTTSDAAAILAVGGQANLRINFYFPSDSISIFIGDTDHSFTQVITEGIWYHLALVRNGDDYTLYLDGMSVFEFTDSYSIIADTLYIGQSGSNADYLHGYLDEIRISKGVARWTEDFIPPVDSYPFYDAPVVVDDETVLLIHADGDDASTDIKDYGTTGHIITAVGDAQVSTTESKFGDSSVYFDGTGDYLNVIGNLTDFEFGSGQFTIEAWVYLDKSATPHSYIMGYGGGVDTFSTTNGNAWSIFYVTENLYFRWNTGGSYDDFITSVGNISYAWHHIAITQDASNTRLFFDGVLINTRSAVTISDISSPLRLALGDGAAVGAAPMEGYIDECRITKGVARWTENFTPPTAPYPEVKDSNTKLLLHAETFVSKGGYAPDTYVKDSSESNHDVFVGSTASLSAAQSKFGSKSISFDDTTTSRLTVANHIDFFPETGALTIDFWIRFNAFNVTTLVSSSFDANNWWSWYYDGNNLQFTNQVSGSPTVNLNGAWAGEVVDTWYHMALVRESNGTYYMFVDGVSLSLTGTNPDTSSIDDHGGPLHIAGAGDGNELDGYMDEIRISKGIARWTANFTPPTLPYSDYM